MTDTEKIKSKCGRLKNSLFSLTLKIVLLVLITFIYPYLASAQNQKQFTSVEILTGHLWSPVIGAHHRQDLDYTCIYIRSDLKRLFSKTFILGELTFNHTTKGPEGYMAGFTFLMRHNFMKVDKITPYIQIGTGILYSNVYKDKSQDLMGSPINFNPQVGGGVSFYFSRKLKMHLELTFQHISNGGLKRERNIGVNGVGGMIGIAWDII